MGGKSAVYVGVAHVCEFCEERIGPCLGVSVYGTGGESRE